MATPLATAPLIRHSVGVLGGMGPEATVDFMSRVIELTPAAGDQDHIRMLVESNPAVPDRQQAMASGEFQPVRDALTAMAQHLEGGGAEFLVMPCNTAHAFIDDGFAAVSIPFVSIIDVTIDAVTGCLGDARSVGLLATDACIASGVYARAADAAGLELVLPDAESQQECMRLIFSIKGGQTGPEVRQRMATLAEQLHQRGAHAVIAGCTEIPLVLARDAVAVPLISSTEMLARRTVGIATGALPLPSKNR